ncbi:hypothetical protein GCM10018785_45330 [Streptomyces longispororuber]|uniref:Uncharacterized protein n=1 Tax=Streptomyces longispororuber TaxID=68230 RepID=A0A919DQM1_9ACTN|nr:hypothetical protein GCM10018785_45330 [Streptomyces longispororuber]
MIRIRLRSLARLNSGPICVINPLFPQVDTLTCVTVQLICVIGRRAGPTARQHAGPGAPVPGAAPSYEPPESSSGGPESAEESPG